MDDDIKSSARNLLYFYWNQLITRERENSFKKWRTKGNTWLCFEYDTKELQLSSSEDVFCGKPRNVTVINSVYLSSDFEKQDCGTKGCNFCSFWFSRGPVWLIFPMGRGHNLWPLNVHLGVLIPGYSVVSVTLLNSGIQCMLLRTGFLWMSYQKKNASPLGFDQSWQKKSFVVWQFTCHSRQNHFKGYLMFCFDL